MIAEKRKGFELTNYMVCRAFFLQRALCTVYCANIMHSRKPSLVISPAVFSLHCKSLFFNIHGNYICHIWLKKNNLIIFYISTVKYSWFSPCTWRNKVMFKRRSKISKRVQSHSRALTIRFFVLWLWRHGVEWDCDVIAKIDNGSVECIVPLGSDLNTWNVRFESRLILPYFLNHFSFYVMKWIKNGCPSIVEMWDAQGCALVGDPQRAAGSL